MNRTLDDAWEFGGGLAGLAPTTAWMVLIGLGTLCLVYSWWAYRRAERAVAGLKRAILVGLRFAFFGTLLVCLANPSRIERVTVEPPSPAPPDARRLAVVVDRSDSMTRADNRGRTRLDDALAGWRRLVPAAQTAYAQFDHFSVAADLRPAKSLEDAAARKEATGETRLFQSVSSLLERPPGSRPHGVVVLTDGVDTTFEQDGKLRDAALAAGVPLFFVAGSNRSDRPEPFFRIREWRAPTSVAHHSDFTIEATVESFSREDRTVPLSLWQGDKRVGFGNVALNTGPNLVPVTYKISAGEPGVLDFVLRLGPDATSPIAAQSATRVLGDKKVKLLFYQGALDWGFRYFIDALRTDTNFEFTTVLNPAVGLTMTRSSKDAPMKVGDLPSDPAALADYDCVVLAHLYPRQLNLSQQKALVEFARRGGSVLFVSPDAEALPQFRSSQLADLLPVVFAAEAMSQPIPGQTARRERPLPQLGRKNQFDGTETRREAVKLTSLELTSAGQASPIFALAGGAETARLVPHFLEYTKVSAAKPGAEVLAVHPSDTDPSGNPRVLLATQPFGSGQTALLATDGLWRWKLAEKSTARTVETFWQQLLLAVGKATPIDKQVTFTNAPSRVLVGERVTVLLAAEQMPTLTVRTGSAAAEKLVVTASTQPNAQWQATWKPEIAGPWELTASLPQSLPTRIFPTVVAEAKGELAGTPTAIEPLRALASATGGALLSRDPPAVWRPAKQTIERGQPYVSERRQLRWNEWWVLAFALGAFATELILRRTWRLV